MTPARVILRVAHIGGNQDDVPPAKAKPPVGPPTISCELVTSVAERLLNLLARFMHPLSLSSVPWMWLDLGLPIVAKVPLIATAS